MRNLLKNLMTFLILKNGKLKHMQIGSCNLTNYLKWQPA